MANVITLQPNLSMHYSAGKSEEDLIKPDNIIDHLEPNNDGERTKDLEAGGDEGAGYKEETFCDYFVSISQCSSWLCANIISSIVLCFENCVDFVHTCKCNNLCCDVCGGSEDSLGDHRDVAERNNDLNESGPYEDEYIMCEYTQDIEEELPDSCVIVERRRTSEADEEKLKEVSNQNQTKESEDKKKNGFEHHFQR